ncbi:MAG: metallophosphoesterase family protein [Anaerolineales bacterium]|jgi:diadenosine tetraphosphatase ApaH/serine/threonine PP2A family protein phosphatase
MKILIISDIHANLQALETVLEDAPSFDAVWCLGDLVGYGPNPNECIQRVRKLPELICLSGNHDHAAVGLIPLSRFNEEARSIVDWTRNALNKKSAGFLGALPVSASVGEFTLVHGSPLQPVWEYIMDLRSADRNFEAFSTNYCLVGHSHLPLIYHQVEDDHTIIPIPVHGNQSVDLYPRMILNPGSVGQPRDSDPRASYALLDLESMTWKNHRVPYDIQRVQELMLEAGLPYRQAMRLKEGW